MKIGKQVIATIVVALALWAMNINPFIAFWVLSVFLMFLSNTASFCNDFNMVWVAPFAGVSILATLATLVFVPSVGVSFIIAAALMTGISAATFFLLDLHKSKAVYLIASASYYVLMFFAAYFVYA